MTIKTTFFAAALALSLAAALGAPADAAPVGGGTMMGGMHNNMGHADIFHDRSHRPPARSEVRPHQPRGHYRWRAGAWSWNSDHWDWAPGLWVRF
ncbi:MAG TPA: hypothetical protein VNU97_12110 [Rhizomicrobium sp.]|jgi:hypothetical protein|nr:hypothetical protein [Rhizomicrobium sp.]